MSDEQIKHDQIIYAIALDVIDGKWGSGSERKRNLKQSGFDYDEIQNMVNRIMMERSDEPEKDKLLDAILDKLHNMIVTADDAKIRKWVLLISMALTAILVLFVFAAVGIAIRLSI